MYLKKLLLVILLSLGLAYILGFGLDQVYKKRWSVLWFQKTDALINSSSYYDVIFLGNSRVHFAINPFYIDSVTGLRSYNFGSGGADTEEMLMTTKIYLSKHPSPKIVLISLDPGTLLDNRVLKSRYHYLFYLENDSLNRYMKDVGFPTYLIKIFPFLKYSFFDEYNRTSLFVKGKPYPSFDHNRYNGFLNIHQFLKANDQQVYNAQPVSTILSPGAVVDLENTIRLLQKINTAVIFIWPPLRSTARHKKIAIERKADSIFLNIADKFKLAQFNFENDSIYKDEYFVDDIHFNEPGARIYSRAIGDSIRSYMAKNKIPFPL